jgi:two-component system, OmpR family, KDP operon response regulator KdpE
MSRVLIVDDEPQIIRTLTVTLRAHGFETDEAANGTRAVLMASANNPDVIVLDLGLPDIDGVEVVRRVRRFSSVPIVILSVREADADKVEALDAGADDYVTKPFSTPELLARLRAAIRRHQPPAYDPIVTTRAFRLDLTAKRSWRDNDEVHLTPTEWQLVEFLVRNPERLVSQRELLEHVWGPTCPHEPSYLRVHIGHIRKKLESVASRPRYFLTEAGMGYRFVDDRKE